MAFKLMVFAAFIAVARVGITAVPVQLGATDATIAAPAVTQTGSAVVTEFARAPKAIAVDPDFDPNPTYLYAYEIKDEETGDAKTQFEIRSGGLVKGRYSVVGPDSRRRIVDYTAHPVNGFHANVHYEPAEFKVAVPEPIVGKVFTAPESNASTNPVASA